MNKLNPSIALFLVSVCSVMTTVLCEMSARTTSYEYLRWYQAALVVGTALVGVTGHFGGTLIYGRGYYSW